MQWMVPEERLGADQKEIIEEIAKIGKKPIWIKGNAGSGKSVVLIQSVKDYLANHPDAKVCIVVFNRAKFRKVVYSFVKLFVKLCNVLYIFLSIC